jgi:hypothetical protein
MLNEDLLDLARANILTAADNDVLDPASHTQHSTLIDSPEVTEPIPFTAKRAMGEVGIAQIADEQLRSARHDLTFQAPGHWPPLVVHDGHLYARQGPAIGGQTLVSHAGLGSGSDVGLAGAEDSHKFRTEGVTCIDHEIARDGRPARCDVAEGFSAMASPRARRYQIDDERRRSKGVSALVSVDQLQR